MKTRNYPGGRYLQTSAQAVTQTSAATTSVVEQFTDQVNVRLRGRSFAIKVASTDTEVEWRLGSPRIEVRTDGAR
jgi:hypothetical protein